MSDGIIDQFVNSSAIRETWWYMDPDTKEIVCYCKSCDAEARFTVATYQGFQFAHRDSCPHSDEKRAQRLVDAVITVLEEESDRHVAFSAVTFVMASMCAVAADEGGVPLETMAKRFVRVFEDRVGDVGPIVQIVKSWETNAA